MGRLAKIVASLRRFSAVFAGLFHAISRFPAWQILLACSMFAGLVSLVLKRLTDWNSDHYVYPILIGIWFFFFLRLLLKRPYRTEKESGVQKPFEVNGLLRPFTRWNLYFFLMGSLFLLYPFSATLQNIGALPLFVFVALLDGLFSTIRKRHGFTLAALSGSIGLVIFAWLWELAGTTDLVVLPVDLPKVQDAQFTPEGATKTLLTAITNFPPREAPVTQPPETTRGSQGPKEKEKPFIPSSTSLAAELGRTGLPGGREDILHDTPHLIGLAELGGVPLEPVYHALRHLRHMPTLEAQILVGRDDSLTLGLRRSDFPPSCYSEQLPEKLLDHEPKHEGKRALQELQKIIRDDIADELKTEKRHAVECNPPWNRRVLKFFGVSDLPGEQDERISNVTAVGLRPDEQLTQLIDRALLEGMDRIFPEKLGLFHDARGRPDSALVYYRQALPRVVQQASEEGGNARSRLRVAQLLIRIADLEAKPKKVKDEKGNNKKWEETATEAFQNAKRHFDAAVALVPEDPGAHALLGYFLLHSTMALLRDELVDKNKALYNYAESEKAFWKAIELSCPSCPPRNPVPDTGKGAEAFWRGVKLRSETASAPEHGKEFTQDLLIFSLKNLALALVVQAQLQEPTDPRREGRIKGASSALDVAKNLLRKKDEGKYEDLKQDPEELDPDILATRGRISWVHNECAEAKSKFDQASSIIINWWDLDRLLLLEEAHQPALQQCGTKDDYPDFHSALYSLALARDHYQRANYDKSANDLANGRQAATNLNRRVQAIFPRLRATVLLTQACDRQADLDEKRRDNLRQEADSQLSTAITVLTKREPGEPVPKELDSTLWEAKSDRAELLAMSPPQPRPRALRIALADATQAAANEPDKTEFKKALGTVQLRQGDLSGALKTFQQAAKLDSFMSRSFDPEVHYLLGFALMEDGADQRASDEWKFAKSLDPDRWPYLSNPLPGCGPIFGSEHLASKKPSGATGDRAGIKLKKQSR